MYTFCVNIPVFVCVMCVCNDTVAEYSTQGTNIEPIMADRNAQKNDFAFWKTNPWEVPEAL